MRQRTAIVAMPVREPAFTRTLHSPAFVIFTFVAVGAHVRFVRIVSLARAAGTPAHAARVAARTVAPRLAAPFTAVAGAEGADGALVPAGFEATTVTVYGVPGCRPSIVHAVAAAEQLAPPGAAVAV